MKKYNLLIVGVGKSAIEIHVVDFYSNDYINRFFVLGDNIKCLEKILTAIELYETNSIIVDRKSINAELLRNMEEKNIC
jgi:hypothetical protein